MQNAPPVIVDISRQLLDEIRCAEINCFTSP